MKELLTKLANTYGASGREESIASLVKSELEDSADSVKMDKFGNVIATKEGSSNFSIMLAAHTDEIGLAVEKVSEDGFAFPARVGGWDPRILPTNPMKSDDGWGLVSTSPIELLDEEDKKKAVRHKDLFIEAQDLSPGGFLVQDAKVTELGNPNVVVGKSLDDRAGLSVMIEAFKKIEDFEPNIHAVGTVQEEVGLRGAGVAAYKLNPDLGIVLEVALADDVPVGGPHTPVVRLGKGPAITVKDASMISHPKLTNFLIQVAESEEIPYQLELLEHGGTDAGRIHLTREGVPSSVIGIPTRYLHSPVEVLDVKDLERGVDLLASTLESLKHSDLESFSTPT
ncbi:hypothetical protein AKJ47_00040 [candidate division MSBL1 archaeon SCGC-AAA261G05]|uniref:Peptidase M42 n=3 Tax=candidate division MSBL1 TaxID=215777 RepID=A0A133UZG8_9EURY|nr:hypothetical protein AKJ42_02995 [candidate division MSBL1 archaeon SCGC-AAA261C02]KXB04236.1 hypothetical protein AKJ47_00040 [candidate division MSBL1 archaeon SCGC-AAA261G05]KXB05099.1 hypothetical protein AKJ48_00065 [candidate division MSBL1 archaeon SCGC-AAA261O19]